MVLLPTTFRKFIVSNIHTIRSKFFHHGNLELQICHDFDLDIISINVHRHNDNTNHDMWGMFLTLESAIKKFETISL